MGAPGGTPPRSGRPPEERRWRSSLGLSSCSSCVVACASTSVLYSTSWKYGSSALAACCATRNHTRCHGMLRACLDDRKTRFSRMGHAHANKNSTKSNLTLLDYLRMHHASCTRLAQHYPTLAQSLGKIFCNKRGFLAAARSNKCHAEWERRHLQQGLQEVLALGVREAGLARQRARVAGGGVYQVLEHVHHVHIRVLVASLQHGYEHASAHAAEQHLTGHIYQRSAVEYLRWAMTGLLYVLLLIKRGAPGTRGYAQMCVQVWTWHGGNVPPCRRGRGRRAGGRCCRGRALRPYAGAAPRRPRSSAGTPAESPPAPGRTTAAPARIKYTAHISCYFISRL